MISRTNTVLAILLALVALLAVTAGVDYSQPNVEILADTSMKYTPASTTYERCASIPNSSDEPTPIFPNRMTQQRPIDGTIAQGDLPLHFAAVPADAELVDAVPGREFDNPRSFDALLAVVILERQLEDDAEEKAAAEAAAKAAAEGKDAVTDEDGTDEDGTGEDGTGEDGGGETEAESVGEPVETKQPPEAIALRRFNASINRGDDTFQSFCVCCHGGAGEGDGMVRQRGYPPPPSFLLGTSMQWDDGQLFHILTFGRNKKAMPPFAAELPRERRWDVINYVRSLQKNAPEPPSEDASSSEEATSEESSPGTESADTPQ